MLRTFTRSINLHRYYNTLDIVLSIGNYKMLLDSLYQGCYTPGVASNERTKGAVL